MNRLRPVGWRPGIGCLPGGRSGRVCPVGRKMLREEASRRLWIRILVIDLVDGTHHRHAHRPKHFGELRLFLTRAAGGIEEVENRLDLVERLGDDLPHVEIELALGVMKAGGVEKHDLPSLVGEDTANLIAGRLGGGRHNRDFMAADSVQQGGFSR